jgi:hypothetical protein
MSVAGRALAWLTLATLAAGMLTVLLAPRDIDDLPDGFESAMVALAFAPTVKQATALVDGSERRGLFVRASAADLAFAVASTGLWSVMAWQVAPWAAAPALGAGLAHLAEKAAVFATLREPTAASVDWGRRAARARWLLLGVALVGLGASALRRTPLDGWDFAGYGVDLAYVYAGVVCLAGVFFAPPVVERAALPLGAALVTQLAVAALRPRR